MIYCLKDVAIKHFIKLNKPKNFNGIVIFCRNFFQLIRPEQSSERIVVSFDQSIPVVNKNTIEKHIKIVGLGLFV